MNLINTEDGKEMAIASKLKTLMGDKHTGKGKLMSSFVNSIVGKAAQQIANSENCRLHKDEDLVAIDPSNNFGCERCVFENEDSNY